MITCSAYTDILVLFSSVDRSK